MRLDKPAPIYLTYWPSAWAILGAASYQHAAIPDFYLLGLFALGAMTMRSAGCIINDIWDRKLDQKVERTKNRPLASGQVSLPSAYLLLLGNLSVSLSILFQLNLTTQLLGACCLFPVAIYPAAKRFTNWPQAVLGVTFNWGALMGWSAVICSTASQSQSLLTFLPAIFLYAGAINWTLFYDTIYAFQDKDCDIKNGIRSTAIHLQNRPKLWLLGFSSLFASNLAVFGWLTSQEPIFYMAIGLAFAHTLKQLALVKLNSPESCQKQFKSNNTIGAILTFGLLASIFIK
jgi:4-hydroxybenzoate polyprenyltransferase